MTRDPYQVLLLGPVTFLAAAALFTGHAARDARRASPKTH